MAVGSHLRLSPWLPGRSRASVHGCWVTAALPCMVWRTSDPLATCPCRANVSTLYFTVEGVAFKNTMHGVNSRSFFRAGFLDQSRSSRPSHGTTPIGQPSAQGRPMAIPGALPLGSPTRRVAQRASEGAARQTPGQLNSRTSATLHRNAPYTCARKKRSAGTSTEEHRGTVGWQRARGLSSVCSVSQSVTHSKLRSLPCP